MRTKIIMTKVNIITEAATETTTVLIYAPEFTFTCSIACVVIVDVSKNINNVYIQIILCQC